MKLSGKWMDGATAWAWHGGQWLSGIVENVGRTNLHVFTHADQELRAYPADRVRPRSTHLRGNDTPTDRPIESRVARRIKVTA